ncbi:DUF2946 family protein [Pararhizobium qamdonense]|uniref:DUF2946 family protein n=1 Tax=Pararhizobium qamdonense TaxID=3031126 RepID=UPI0023E1908D|nr:DUF2946 family protein [Pararhizobium qamdonense]
MKTLRLVLKDRVSAGAIAVLIASMFLLQGLVAGVAHGTMASAAVDPFNIICIAHEDGPQQTSPGVPQKAAHDMCATLCQLAAGHTPALPGRAIEIAAPVLGHPVELYFAVKPAPRVFLRSTFAEARAPPSLSA